MPAPTHGSPETTPGDVHAQIFTELQVLAASQRRIETALSDTSSLLTKNADTMADVTKDLGAVVNYLSSRGHETPGGTCALGCRRPSKSGPGTHAREEDEGLSSGCVSQVFSDQVDRLRTASVGDNAVALPVRWPVSIELRAAYESQTRVEISTIQVTKSSWFRNGRRSSEDSEAVVVQSLPSVTSDTNHRNVSRCAKHMISPDSYVHFVIGLCTVGVLGYDLCVVPFLLAWDIPFDGLPNIASVMAAVFWTIDMLLNFSSGYYRGGVLVMDPRLVARHYVRTWFIPDILVLVCDWVSILFILVGQSDSNASRGGFRMLRLLKSGRLLRMIAMCRMAKFAHAVEEQVESFLSETSRLLLKILVIFVGILWLNHLLACAFFAIGRASPTNTGARWTDSVYTIGDTSFVFLEQGILYQYITSFHWSMAQTTLGAIEIYAANTSERAFSILMLLLGLVVGCTMISSLSATMVEFQMLSKDRNDKLRTLRRYLSENNVDRKLALLVHQQAAERLGKKARLSTENVHALSMISVSLQAGLHFEICRPYIIQHPLWRLWADMDASMARHFCFECVELRFPAPLDDIFLAGTDADSCYFVATGRLTYTQDTVSSKVTQLTVTPVGESQWICEAALWSHWIHVGNLKAETGCHLLVVQAQELDQVLQRNRVIREITREYCKHFHKRMVSAKPPSAPWPDDLKVPFAEYSDIVVSMAHVVRHTIGMEALDRVATSLPWTLHRMRIESGLERLRAELRAGDSTVIVNGNGQVERIVSVVAIRIERSDGSIFAQLASRRDSVVVPACQLPGGKQKHDELAGDTVRRVLERLSLVDSGITILDSERTVDVRESKEYGVRTRYLRTEFHAMIESEFAPANMEAQRLICRKSTVDSTSSKARGLDPAAFTTKFSTTSLPREVFVHQAGDKTHFFAWLAPGDFESLQTAAGEAALLNRLTDFTRDTSTRSYSASLEQTSTWQECSFGGPCQTV